MSTDYTKPPFGMFGYDDVKNQWTKDEPKQSKKEEPVATEDKSIFEKIKEAVLPDNEEEVKTEPAVQIEEEVKQATTIIDPVKEEPEAEEEPTKFKWTVPKNTTAVYVNIYDSEGKFIDYYTITKFITLKPGQVLEVVAK